MVAPGLATPAKRLHLAVSSLAHLVGAGIDAELIVAGGVPSDSRVRSQADAAGVGDRVREPGYVSPADFVSALVAADVVLGLRFPSHGETSAASIRALGLGACVFLTAGSETAMDIPRGACVAVVPGPSEGEELSALLLEVARQPDWRRSVGAAARDHIARHHSVSGTVASLVEFLEEVRELRVARSSSKKDRSPSQSRFEDPIGLASYLVEEALLAGLELGVDPGLLFIEESVRSLLGGPV